MHLTYISGVCNHRSGGNYWIGPNFSIDIMNFICLKSNTSCHILHKSCQEPVTKVKMNLQGHQDRKYMSLNLLIPEDNLHVEYTLFFTFSSVCNVPIS